MTALAELEAEILSQPISNNNNRYKINTWKGKFITYYTGRDDRTSYGLNRPIDDLLPEIEQRGLIPRGYFVDYIVAGFIAHSFHHFKLHNLKVEPNQRALQWYLVQHIKEYNLGAPKWSELPNFQRSQLMMRRMVDSKEYKECQSQHAPTMTNQDITMIKMISIRCLTASVNGFDRLWLMKKYVALLFLQLTVRYENMHGLNRNDVKLIDINKDEPNKKRLLCVEVTFRGANREKHAKKDTVHYAMCECQDVHTQVNEECVCTLAAFYHCSRVEDDDFILQQTRSSLKFKDKDSEPYWRRVMWRNRSDHSQGNYLSLIRRGGDFFKNLADDLDRELQLSCFQKTNPDAESAGNRPKFCSHSWKRTSNAVVERKYGDDPTVTLETKMRLANQKQPAMYSLYAEDGRIEMQNAIRMKKRLQRSQIEDKENMQSNSREIVKNAPSEKKRKYRRRKHQERNGRKCLKKGAVETVEDAGDIEEVLSMDDERESVVKVAKYGLRGRCRQSRQRGFYNEDRVWYKGYHSKSGSVSKKRHRPY